MSTLTAVIRIVWVRSEAIPPPSLEDSRIVNVIETFWQAVVTAISAVFSFFAYVSIVAVP